MAGRLYPADFTNICGASTTDLEGDVLSILQDGVERGENCTGPQSTTCAAGVGPDFSPYDTPIGQGDYDIDCGYISQQNQTCTISPVGIAAAASAISSYFEKNWDENSYDWYYGDNSAFAAFCDDAGQAGDPAYENAVTGNELSSAEFVGSQIHTFLYSFTNSQYGDQEACHDIADALSNGVDGYLSVDVTCKTPGVFDLSFAPELRPDFAHGWAATPFDRSDLPRRPGASDV